MRSTKKKKTTTVANTKNKQVNTVGGAIFKSSIISHFRVTFKVIIFSH